MAKSIDRDKIYEAAALFVERALRSDDSLFAAGHRVWTRENAEDLFKRFNEQPITTSESFDAKLQQQLAGAPDDTIHLAAEILFVHLLIVADIKSRKKREIIDGVEALSSQPVAIPPNLEASLDAGLAAGGMGFRTWRPSQVGFFVEFLRSWKSLAQGEQQQLLEDPWEFRTFIFGIPENSGFAQRSALLHLIHPESFEPIVSRGHKKAIAKAFGHLVSDPTDDVDRQLFQIRSQLASRLGRETFHFYEPDVLPQWKPNTSDADRWDAFIEWAKKLFARPTFDAEERNYKLEVAENVRHVRDAIRSAADWLPALKKAFGKPNNLTDWRANDKFSKWANADTDGASSALTALWDAAASPPDAVKAFLELAPKNAVSGAQLSVSSFFLLGLDATQFAFYRAQVVEKACRLTGYPTPPNYLDRGARYEHFLGFLDRVVEEAETRGLELRDRLDAQSLVWWIVQGDPPADWSDEERAAFTAYREGKAEPHKKETSVPPIGSGDLAELVNRFRHEAPYPGEKHAVHQRAREEFASFLTPEALQEPDWDKIQLLFSSNKYGSPGPQAELNRYITAADDARSGKLRDAIVHLLYGDGELSKRLDDLITGEFKIPGLGESVATKFLAITQPSEIIPAYVTDGKVGKAKFMQLPPFSLVPPSGTRGERAMKANDLLRTALEPFFGNDMWGMKEFLFWLNRQAAPEPVAATPLRDLADDLLLSEAWLSEVLALLRDRKQIIFYGPPGTGKTYIARKIMEFLASHESRRAVVQFHPSYSYEDFVQGYRPIAGDDGVLSYTLKPGPLMRLATRARESDEEHVLLIDEINRGNLPKILGELLYLLEYRDDEIDLMYAEGTSRFSMPENLLVIGTMNTADRSIGLIDAALRRRFHFIPLFPNDEPLVGLLDRWFQRFNPTMIHVGDLVDRLNARLRQQFGPHLQVGPSHFFKRDLDETLLRRIWKHDVMPFLEDQLFSHENELAAYTIDNLMGQSDADDSVEGASDVESDAPNNE